MLKRGKALLGRWYLPALVLLPILPGWGEAVVELSAFPVFAGLPGRGSGLPGEQLSERMEREVRVDLQTRGGQRYQSDISIRGGIFEGTGLMVGGLALFDPQTGHYAAEIPLNPGFFSGARLFTGVNNSINGFNSTAGSIDWQWAPVPAGGQAGLTVGTDAHRGGRILTGGVEERVSWQLGLTREAGDGSRPGGDFDLRRASGRLELDLGRGSLRVFGGLMQKFYGWPGMYTGNPGLLETEDYVVGLAGWQYALSGTSGSHRVGGIWRRLEDDYEFNRLSPNAFFEHLTEVWSLQGDGLVRADRMEIRYRWVFLKDEIRRSTSLVNGDFLERRYGKASVLLQRRIGIRWGELIPYGGIVMESSDRDATVGLPQAGIRLSGSLKDGAWEVYAEYSESSQVPGYTVLNSAPQGLFGGNSELGRESAQTLEAGVSVQSGWLLAKGAVFRRKDHDLVDWVYESASPAVRQASAMDITVSGFEGYLRWEPGAAFLELGYAWLDKDPAYTGLAGDASFYALNYARHRVLASVGIRPGGRVSLRLDGAYRLQKDNPLRKGDDRSLKLHVQAVVEDFPASAWRLLLRVENLTDEAFQSVPGTPGPGREARVVLGYAW